MPGGRGRKLHPDELDEGQRALYEAITTGPRSTGPGASSLLDDEGRLEGPFNAFLLQPSVGGAWQSVGASLRYETQLPGRSREIAILVVAAHHGAEFEQHVHEPIARRLGVTAEQLAGIRRSDVSVLARDEALIAAASQQMLSTGGVDDETYARLDDLFGEAGIFELTSVVGYYSVLALQLRVFDVQLPQTSVD
jgi:4-carboxymuconolactone decarboxylase